MSGGNLPRLKECLVELRLPTFREHHGSQAALATKESWSYPQYLLALSELEVADRRERRIQKLRRTSKLPWDKSLTSLDRSRLPQSVDRQLSGLVEGDFLDRAENLLVFGNPGSGKTHLVCALGQELILRDRRVLFSTCALLVQRLLSQARANSGEGTQEAGSVRGPDHRRHRVCTAESRRDGDSLHVALPSLRASLDSADQQPGLLGLGEDLQGSPDHGRGNRPPGSP